MNEKNTHNLLKVQIFLFFSDALSNICTFNKLVLQTNRKRREIFVLLINFVFFYSCIFERTHLKLSLYI